LLLGACKAMEAVGLSNPGYRLSIEQSVNLSDQLLGLYIIVADRGLVIEKLKEEDYGAVLAEDKIEEYTAFRQYTPEKGGGWRRESTGNTHQWVIFKDTETAIELLVDHDLISKSSDRFCVVAIGQYATKFDHVLVDDATLNAKEKQRLEVGRARLAIVADE